METKECRDCRETKPLSDFYRFRSKSTSGRMPVCKKCHVARCEAQRKALPKEARSERYRRQRQINLEGRKASEKRWHANSRANGTFPWDTRRSYGWLWRERQKAKVFEGYGGCCECCGEDELHLLTIDHVDDSGGAERRKGMTTRSLYGRLIREGFPEGYRVLCFSCNTGRSITGGICSHQLACPNIILLALERAAEKAA